MPLKLCYEAWHFLELSDDTPLLAPLDYPLGFRVLLLMCLEKAKDDYKALPATEAKESVAGRALLLVPVYT